MTYIYDILLNFKDELIEFYDWNKNDNIIHIRKIPLFKITSKDLYNIKNSNIKFEYNFLEKIKNKTELFTSKLIKKIEYMFLISDGNTILAILKQDKKIKKSSLLIDEELDTLEEVKLLDYIDVEYKILEKEKLNELKTRKQKEIEKFIIKEINKIKNEEEKLKYIYYECFDKKETNIEKIIYKIKEGINDTNVSKKIYNFLKLIEVHK